MLLAWLGAGPAWADKPRKMVVPFAPGGLADKLARALATELADAGVGRWVVENRPGADGLIALDQMLRPGESDSTVMLITSFFTARQAEGRLPADKASRFRPLVHVGDMEVHLIAGKHTSLKSLSDIGAGTPRAKPLACASSAGQFATICSQVAQAYPQHVTPVVYRGEAQALNDLLGGHTDFMPVTYSSARPHLASGAVVTLANLSRPGAATRGNNALPYVLTTPIKAFYGLIATDEMPEATARQLNLDVNKALKSPGFQEVLRALDLQIAGGTASDFERLLRDNVATQTRLLGGTR